MLEVRELPFEFETEMVYLWHIPTMIALSWEGLGRMKFNPYTPSNWE
jgi:hypothetical protein